MIKKAPTVIGLATVLLLSLAASAGPLHASGWKMLPDDVIAAVHLDMESLGESDLYKTLLEQFGDQIDNPGARYLAFVEATGFDVKRDLETLTIGAGLPDDGERGAFYLVASGAFDREKIDAYVNQSGEVEIGSHGKLTTYVPLGMDYDGAPPMAAWLNDKTMIVASAPDFPRLASSVKGSGLTAKNSKLGQLLDTARGQFYLAMEIPTATDGADSTGKGLSTLFTQLQSPGAGPMQNLQTILVTLDAKTGLDFAVRASTDSAENGRLVYEMLNGYLTMGRAMAAQNPEAAPLLNQIQLEHEGAGVEISVSMSGDDVRAAIEQSRARKIAEE